MADMRQFPAQERGRRQWIIDTVRANQRKVSEILMWVWSEDYRAAKGILDTMYKQDRDALLQPNGILTEKQIEGLQ